MDADTPLDLAQQAFATDDDIPVDADNDNAPEAAPAAVDPMAEIKALQARLDRQERVIAKRKMDLAQQVELARQQAQLDLYNKAKADPLSFIREAGGDVMSAFNNLIGNGEPVPETVEQLHESMNQRLKSQEEQLTAKMKRELEQYKAALDQQVAQERSRQLVKTTMQEHLSTGGEKYERLTEMISDGRLTLDQVLNTAIARYQHLANEAAQLGDDPPEMTYEDVLGNFEADLKYYGIQPKKQRAAKQATVSKSLAGAAPAPVGIMSQDNKRDPELMNQIKQMMAAKKLG